MKKLIVLSPKQIEYVEKYARAVATRGESNFSKAVRYIIDEHERMTNGSKK